MKKLLTVMAVFLCACFSMGFTIHPGNNHSTTTTNLRSRILYWKHTTWVNPWANAKRLTAKNLYVEAGAIAGRTPPPTICKLTWADGSADLSTTASYDNWQITIPTDRVITYEFNIAWHVFYGELCWLDDATTGENLFAFDTEYQYFQWTPIAGHRYNISVNY